LDLISANSGGHTLSVLTNDGNGSFTLADLPDVGSYPYSVTAADVNGDGKLDLISANRDASTLSVLTNGGNGYFTLAASPSVGSSPTSVTAADVNGDGKLDLISANSGTNTLAVLINGAAFDGTFSGDGAGLTGLNAANLTGTMADARLSANVALRGGGNAFTGDQTIAGNLSFGNTTRQMLNLYGTDYAIGAQYDSLYFRCANFDGNSGFSWYKGGVHDDGYAQPGAGGIELMHLIDGGLYVHGTFVNSSDRNVKQDFAAVNSRAVLEKVAQLPIQTWVYKSDPHTKHLGPVAQDFYAAFAVGPDDKHITTVDESGVALAAIQGLNQKVDSETAGLRAENAEMKRELSEIKQLLLKLSDQKD
jgi:hypothetical protein